ncbi:MAG: hypothetical protein IT363_02020 [Methanoregulaceae archaeon]|nr:hypothetical protein [Methanoregulaceae archaeon]
MRKRVRIPDVGIRFEFPDVEATGLVVAHHQGVPLSYFFPFKMLECPDSELRPENAILVAWHNLVPYFILGTITQQRTVEDFNPAIWPWPISITSTQWGRGRCEGNLMQDPYSPPPGGGHIPLSRAAAKRITSDSGFHSLGIVSNNLKRILTAGDVVAGRTYFFSNPKPDGGKLLKRYLREKGRLQDSP